MRRFGQCLAVLAALLLPAGTGLAAGERPQVYAVNYPLAYFAERLGDGMVDVHFPVPADADPAYWRPTAEEIARFQQADLILLNGAGYARWTAQASLPRRVLRDTSAARRDRYIAMEADIRHRHGPAGAHVHDGFAFTTWLDFDLAQAQAAAVAAALAELLPSQAGAIEARLRGVQDELQALDARLMAAATPVPLLASHPVYQYLAARYALNLHALHWEPEEMPDDGQWRGLAALQAQHGARWMLWEGEPLPEVRARLGRMGIGVAVFAPLGNRPGDGDFLGVMDANVARLEEVLGE